MAHSKARVTDGKVTYPPGVKEISDKISKEEMVRRLKVGLSFPPVLHFNGMKHHWNESIDVMIDDVTSLN